MSSYNFFSAKTKTKTCPIPRKIKGCMLQHTVAAYMTISHNIHIALTCHVYGTIRDTGTTRTHLYHTSIQGPYLPAGDGSNRNNTTFMFDKTKANLHVIHVTVAII